MSVNSLPKWSDLVAKVKPLIDAGADTAEIGIVIVERSPGVMHFVANSISAKLWVDGPVTFVNNATREMIVGGQ